MSAPGHLSPAQLPEDSGHNIEGITITPSHGPLVVVADDEVVQRRLGGLQLKKIWWTEESTGTASGLWLQAEADGELLLPIVLSRTENLSAK